MPISAKEVKKVAKELGVDVNTYTFVVWFVYRLFGKLVEAPTIEDIKKSYNE